jgi:hypothetical protein
VIPSGVGRIAIISTGREDQMRAVYEIPEATISIFSTEKQER